MTNGNYTPNWQDVCSKQLQLNDDVHIWKVQLLKSPSEVAGLYDVLSDDERKRADRFYFHKDRNSFIVARGTLRNILSYYLSISPGEIEFVYNSYGKPFLRPTKNRSGLEFNLSHSSDIAIYAISTNRKVGIDIERIRKDFADMEIAKNFFSENEIRSLLSLEKEQRIIAFFNCWTRKEAFIKAVGKGLSIPLDSFDVSVEPDMPAKILRIDNDLSNKNDWTMLSFEPAPHFVSALVVEGFAKNIKWLEWDEITESSCMTLQR